MTSSTRDSQEYVLGEARGSFGPTRGFVAFYTILSVLLILAGSSIVALATAWREEILPLRSEAAGGWAITGLLIGVGVFGLRATRRWKSWRVEIYDRGIACSLRPGHHRIAMFEDIESVQAGYVNYTFNGIPFGNFVTARLRLSGGAVLELKGRGRWWDLTVPVRAIQFNTLAARASRIEAALAQGKCVTFGPVSLDGEGLLVRRKRVAWSDYGGYRLDNGGLMFFDAKTKSRVVLWPVSCDAVWDVDVLLGLLDATSARAGA